VRVADDVVDGALFAYDPARVVLAVHVDRLAREQHLGARVVEGDAPQPLRLLGVDRPLDPRVDADQAHGADADADGQIRTGLGMGQMLSGLRAVGRHLGQRSRVGQRRLAPQPAAEPAADRTGPQGVARRVEAAEVVHEADKAVVPVVVARHREDRDGEER